MINKDVQEVSCDMCSGKKVVEFRGEVTRNKRIPEGWLMIDAVWFSIGTRGKEEEESNLTSEKLTSPLHFCSISCFTNFFSKTFESVRLRSQNGYKPQVSLTDPAYTEAQLTTELFFKKLQ